jgi:transposase
MVDAKTGEIVDMLESRESSEVSKWLSTFPNIEVVSRDGSTLYAKAIRTAHPDAMQVSDRFHIMKGLSDAARQFILSHVGQRVAIPSDTAASSYWQKQLRSQADLPERLHNATTEKRASAIREVRDLAAKGLNLTQIGEVTGHCYQTIKNLTIKLEQKADKGWLLTRHEPNVGTSYPGSVCG